jgi:L-cysteate sulfo-lyase
MNIIGYPKVKLAFLPTPLQKMKKLSKYLGGPSIFMKRDDMTGFLLGGNKIRKLEFLMGDALRKNVDIIITTGSIQSNWATHAAAAAKKFGMEIFLVLCGNKNESIQGNYLLDHILGAEFKFVSSEEDIEHLDVIMQDIAKNYQGKGLKPYILPVGGSTPLGNLGYVNGVLELIYQADQMNIKIDNIVVTAGSCGTIAGILTGLRGFNYQAKTLGMTIGKSKAECINRILSLNTEMVGLLGENFKINPKDIIIYDQYIGEEYGKKNIESIEAIKLTLEKEGILLDPVYTGKTMAGLIDLINKNNFQSDENIVFFHTGGYGGVFGYNDYFI